MKQGTNFILPITIDYDLSLIEKIEFLFRQSKKDSFYNNISPDDIKVTFEYPSSTAVAVNDKNIVNLYWTTEDTYKFNTNEFIFMDTRIHLLNSDENPETSIIKIRMQPTLFDKES